MDTELFNYVLPPERIAQFPAERRELSRMMVLDSVTGETEIHPFSDIVNYLSSGDLICCNNTKVRAGRLYGLKNGDAAGAHFEALLVEQTGPTPAHYTALLKPGKRAKEGTKVLLLDRTGKPDDQGTFFTVLGRHDADTFDIVFSTPDVAAVENRCGHIPLPPYINRADRPSDAERYQTVYAREKGAVAAPTAGLHFTPEIFHTLEEKGVRKMELTLHVGPGTFKTVSVSDLTQHKMHLEEFELPRETADALNACHKSRHKVLAVGTTTVRTLESCAAGNGFLTPRRDRTGIFLYPPYSVRACDLLLTNFHLPKSTLLMLVSCFVDREKMFRAYERAIAEKMRFYSYGDCMLILPGERNYAF